MNIFKRELRANFKSLLIWSGILILFSIMGIGEFSAYYENPDIIEVFENFPPAFLEAANINTLNITTIIGFFGVMFGYYALIVSVFAIMLGADIISKEERDKTAEFALVYPITRAKIVTGKIFAAIVNCIVINLVTWAGVLLLSARFEPDQKFFEFLQLSIIAFFMLEIIFLALGILLGCALKHYKRANSLAVSIVLGTYILSILSGLSDKLEFLKYFTPFNYFSPLEMSNNMAFDTVFLWLSAVITIVAIGLAYLAYAKRDINI
ncbi:MAG: ABC transporter permease subunit [Chloroflexi bacterium]|nr:ABC transporter permease subunit [Chloroflexota bacterium]MBT3670258.1 ABC transporter permease subunit [Chloroflexota bacterium]MBT4003145.1 ABC transporter permease subunit [Chloroflexota bacterium]MBT4306069.1 ABC transporter permease subunit [Chloroflexota bacterium]MBT4534448.1 ABC transporter permease subunit [Chloroflexota bacterium]